MIIALCAIEYRPAFARQSQIYQLTARRATNCAQFIVENCFSVCAFSFMAHRFTVWFRVTLTLQYLNGFRCRAHVCSGNCCKHQHVKHILGLDYILFLLS